MPALFFGHILAGSLALVCGYIALFAAKGGTLHRKSGMFFVYAMLTMGLLGFTLAVVRNAGPSINIPAALLTAYLVITSLTAVRPPAAHARALHIGAMLVIVSVSIVDLVFAFEAMANGGRRQGIPSFPFILFGVIGLLAFAGDVRLLRSGVDKLHGATRLARHLWRMSFALFIAAMSFFLGQAKVIPKPIRIVPLLAMPILVVLVMMLYWLWRVRVRRSLRGLVLGVSPSRTSTSATGSSDSRLHPASHA
jgi:uncharacterized membrane protein